LNNTYNNYKQEKRNSQLYLLALNLIILKEVTMAIIFELMLKFLGKVFNDPNIPWYQNVLPVILIFSLVILVTFTIMKIKKPKKDEK
jgi:hypothetical protein